MANTTSEDDRWQQMNSVIYAGLAGLSMVAIFEIFGKNDLSTWLYVSLSSFATAIPILTIRFLMVHLKSDTSHSKSATTFLDLLGIGGTFLGLICLLFSIWWVAGSIFLGGFIVGRIVLWMSRKRN